MAVSEPLRPLPPAPEPAAPEPIAMRGGRTLTLTPAGADELVEIRSPTGRIEVRIRLTDGGPVLEMESVRLVLRAEESVDVEADEVRLRARSDITLDGRADIRVSAGGDVRVTGETIHLN